jgi:hypothetical protein
LFLASLVVAYAWLRKSLFIYLAAGMLMLTTSHGPSTLGLISMSPYVLVMFPGFMALGCFIVRTTPRPIQFLLWGLSTVMLLGMAARFGSGRWLA